MRNSLISGGIVIAALAASLLGANTTAQAETPNYREVLGCVSSPGACLAANDAANWAYGMAAARYPGSALHNDTGDAYRHCIWSGATAQKVGYDTARDITTRHEDAAAAQGQPAEEYTMDINNNSVGLSIGARANAEGGADTWGYVASQCGYAADTGLLYGIGTGPSIPSF